MYVALRTEVHFNFICEIKNDYYPTVSLQLSVTFCALFIVLVVELVVNLYFQFYFFVKLATFVSPRHPL